MTQSSLATRSGTLTLGASSDDPLEVAQRWVDAGARRLHMVDLNGAFAGEPVNAAPVEAILEIAAAGSSTASRGT